MCCSLYQVYTITLQAYVMWQKACILPFAHLLIVLNIFLHFTVAVSGFGSDKEIIL